MTSILKNYLTYSWLIKLTFISSFIFQLFANYVVVQRWVLPRDVIKEVPLRTVTSCHMECSRTEKCIGVGFLKDPDLLVNDKCLLVKNLRKVNKNGTRIKVHAMIEEQTALKEEKVKKIMKAKEEKVCPADVNGGYGNWSTYTICTKSCGSGLQYRNRTCNQPIPMFGGRNCSILGNDTEARSCNTHPCPVDGGYGKWSSYGTCTKTCGSGTQSRTRLCDTPTPMHGGRDCTSLGSATETKLCNTQPCPINGGYGQWSSYGTCTKTCGSGVQQRSRKCDTPTPMFSGKDCRSLGSATEKKSCNTQTCYGNLALGKSATASTICCGDSVSTPISLLTDGVKTGADFETTCSGGVNPWVKIDLTSEKSIEKVYLYYLTSTDTKKLLGANVDVEGASGVNRCGTASSSRTVSSDLKYYKVICPSTLTGRYVKAQLSTAQSKCLFAIEIEIYGY